QPEDEVVLLGRQGDEEISADEIAAKTDTINYEIFCNFGGNRRKQFLNSSVS
ncbi:MAG: alanine racemase, partial [Deltaproteobacteria bacterium]|nr:alanine racemase [Deltaproteobacteria bacterium]